MLFQLMKSVDPEQICLILGSFYHSCFIEPLRMIRESTSDFELYELSTQLLNNMMAYDTRTVVRGKLNLGPD